jgi:hypothetical protein
VNLSHYCVSMGPSSGGITAIECADIDMNYTPTSFDIYGVGEYYCQGASGYATCNAMDVDQVMYVENIMTGNLGTCGHPGGYYTCSGNCATQRALVSTYHFTGDWQSGCTFDIGVTVTHAVVQPGPGITQICIT